MNDQILLSGTELEQSPLRQGFGDALMELAEEFPDLVVLNADLEGSLKVAEFKDKYPKKFFQVGVAEQIMASAGTGLALYGKIPVITSFAAFSPGLNWSQLRLAAMSKANIKVVSSHYGLNVGEDGASAQMLSDVAVMRPLPNFRVYSPGDYNQTKQYFRKAITEDAPVYFRVTRATFPVFMNPKTDLTKPVLTLREGKDLTIAVTGSLTYEALQTAELLSDQYGIEAAVVNVASIKPLPQAEIQSCLAKTGYKLAVIEEHYCAGGLGSAILEELAQRPPETLLLGVDDKFGKSGPGEQVIQKYELTRTHFAEKISTWLKA